MISAAGSIYPTLLFDKLDEFLLEFEEHDKLIQGGVASEGEAAAYAMVWEWGNIRQVQIGPRTTIGVNPDGSEVFLSIQAPTGWIALNEPVFWDMIRYRLGLVKFHSMTASGITKELEAAALLISRDMATQLKQTVPVDSGELHDSIFAVEAGDYLLEADAQQTALLLEEWSG